MIKNWIDITMPIHENMMVYKNKDEKKPKLHLRANHKDNGHHENSIYMDIHTGTHVDMPLHMLPDGSDSTGFDESRINGECLVIDLSDIEALAIESHHLKSFQIKANDIVVIKTKNAFDDVFNPEYVYLAESGAVYLKDCGVKAVGIDALGIERSTPGHPTHKVLLSNDIYILEGLALKDISAGRYVLHAFPLNILGVEGLPLRAYLEK